MAFNINPGKQQFSATAAQTVFTFNFAIFAGTDLKVYKTLAGAVADDTADILILSTHYTVSINGTLGGTVTLLSGAALSDTITIVRSLPITRTTDYVTNGDLYADTLDLDQDYQTYLVLDQKQKWERSVVLPDTYSGSQIDFPVPSQYKFIRWNLAENGFENVDPSTVLSSSDAAIINNVADFLSIDTSVYTTAIVKDLDRGGTFIWSATGTVNGGTVFAGATGFWNRQYDGALDVKWFGYGLDGNVTLYVATTGSLLNDGFTIGSPLTIQGAFDKIKLFGDILNENWTIQLAAGTYTVASGQLTYTAKSINRVVIKGVDATHPTIPATIIDGGSTGANYAHGLAFAGDGVYVTIQNIKFQNFTGDPATNTRGALLIDDKADAYLSNVHVNSCSWFGVYYSRRSVGRHSGGIINACRNGINTDGAQLSLGYGSVDTTTAPIITNCTENGIYWSRGAQGHCDYVKIEDNAVGLYIAENSRVDCVASDFKRNTVGVRTVTGGIFGDNPSAPPVFNIGTVDANTTSTQFYEASGGSSEMESSNNIINVGFDRTSITHTGTVTNTILSSPFLIKAGRLQGTGKACIVKVLGLITAVTAGTTFHINVGGMDLALQVPAATTNTSFEIVATIFDASAGYRAIGKISQGLNSSRMAYASTGINNNIDQQVSISCALAAVGDSITLLHTSIYIEG